MMRRKWFDILVSFSGRMDSEHFWLGHLLALAMVLAIGIFGAFVIEVLGGSTKGLARVLPAAIGVLVLAWGLATWSHSVSAAKSSVAKTHRGSAGASFAVVPNTSA